MDAKDLGEEVYVRMFQGVFMRYVTLLKTVYIPYALEKSDEKKVNLICEAMVCDGKTKSHLQKRIVKDGLMEKEEVKWNIFIAGCFDQQKYQLLMNIRTILGETEEFNTCDSILTLVVDNEKESIKKLLKKGTK